MARSGLPADRDVAWAARSPKASLIATGAYFGTLVGVRILTTATHSGPGADIDLWGTHIHHFVFGIGAALVLDEFALAVFLKDVYWLPQGSLSLIALAVGLVALVVNAWRSRHLIRSVYWNPPG